jgi:Uma2 family endonuclease
MASVLPDQLEYPLDLREPDGPYEVIDGRFTEKTMGAYECWLAAVIYGVLNRYVEDNPCGRALIEMIFDFRPTIDRERRPDAAFVSFERWGRDRRIPRTRSWAVVPELAVEVVSPTNTADGVAEKLEEYFQVGAQRVWVIYPRQSKVYDYTSPTEVRVFGLGDVLDGGTLLPGFRLPLKSLFEQPGQPA